MLVRLFKHLININMQTCKAKHSISVGREGGRKGERERERREGRRGGGGGGRRSSTQRRAEFIIHE